VGDPEQSRAQLEVARLVLQDRAAIAIQGLVVAFVDHSEGGRVAAAR
jgi:hypothetical protein